MFLIFNERLLIITYYHTTFVKVVHHTGHEHIFIFKLKIIWDNLLSILWFFQMFGYHKLVIGNYH